MKEGGLSSPKAYEFPKKKHPGGNYISGPPAGKKEDQSPGRTFDGGKFLETNGKHVGKNKRSEGIDPDSGGKTTLKT